MEITIKPDYSQVIIEHDGLMVSEPTLEEAVQSYAEGLVARAIEQEHLNDWRN